MWAPVCLWHVAQASFGVNSAIVEDASLVGTARSLPTVTGRWESHLLPRTACLHELTVFSKKITGTVSQLGCRTAQQHSCCMYCSHCSRALLRPHSRRGASSPVVQAGLKMHGALQARSFSIPLRLSNRKFCRDVHAPRRPSAAKNPSAAQQYLRFAVFFEESWPTARCKESAGHSGAFSDGFAVLVLESRHARNGW